MAVLSRAGAKRARAGKHAERAWTCPLCDRTTHGNGAKASHKAKHLRAARLPKGDWLYLIREAKVKAHGCFPWVK